MTVATTIQNQLLDSAGSVRSRFSGEICAEQQTAARSAKNKSHVVTANDVIASRCLNGDGAHAIGCSSAINSDPRDSAKRHAWRTGIGAYRGLRCRRHRAEVFLE